MVLRYGSTRYELNVESPGGISHEVLVLWLDGAAIVVAPWRLPLLDDGKTHAAWLTLGYSGIFQADAFGGYNKHYEAGRSPGLILDAACWAHARRNWRSRQSRQAQSPGQQTHIYFAHTLAYLALAGAPGSSWPPSQAHESWSWPTCVSLARLRCIPLHRELPGGPAQPEASPRLRRTVAPRAPLSRAFAMTPVQMDGEAG
jgi:hypothetical protein